jgi:hypothetical protein
MSVYFCGYLETDIMLLRQGGVAALLAAIFITPCLAEARPKAVSSWAFPAKSAKNRTVKSKTAKRPLNTNYAAKTPGKLLATQNLQAQKDAQRGLQQQLRQVQSPGQSTAQ